MAKKLITIQELHDYFIGVTQRADHHAKEVDEIVYPLLGSIVKYMDRETFIEVWDKEGETGNLLWAIINGTRYAFRYDHKQVTIEIRKKTHRGVLVSTISNKNTLAELYTVFEEL